MHANGLSSTGRVQRSTSKLGEQLLLKNKVQKPVSPRFLVHFKVKAVISNSANAMGFSFYVCLGVLCLFIGAGCLSLLVFTVWVVFFQGGFYFCFESLLSASFKPRWCLKLC